MKFLISSLGVLTFFLVATSARAGVMIEPYAGYNMINYEFTAVSGGSNMKGTANGLDVGARLAYSFTMLFAGIDYDYQMPTFHDEAVGSTDANGTRNTLFGLVGVDAKMARFWLGYGLSSTTVIKYSTGDTTLTGDALKVGAGFSVAPKISLNLEYFMFTPKKIKQGAIDIDTSVVWSKSTISGFGVSLSIPL